MKSIVSIFSFVFCLAMLANAQDIKNNYVKLGQKAVIDGKFKEAVSNLEKAMPAESGNAEVQYMLGYSYYHTNDYAKAIQAFTQVVALKPSNVSAYYYRGRARNIEGNQLSYSNAEREKLLKASIADFTKAVELNSSDLKLYQNRAIAYRDYGILKGQRIPKFYDKQAATGAFKSSIDDFQRLLDANPGRKDINEEVKKAKVYMANLDNK